MRDARDRIRNAATMGKFSYMNAYMSQPKSQLETFRFWQDEDDHLRGYPLDPEACTDVIYVRIQKGAHVATRNVAGVLSAGLFPPPDVTNMF